MISVVVPICNAEKYLAQCLASVLAQTYRDLDVILVDDGSADSSGLVACDFARRDRRVRLLRQPNGGQASARNAGLDLARGEFVAFVDADDWLEPTMCEAMLNRIGGYDVAMCNYWGVDTEGRPSPFDLEQREWTITGANCLANLARGSMLFTAAWNKLYRREQLSRSGVRFDERIRFGEDMDFNARFCAHLGRVVYLPKPLYHYRDHAESVSSRFKPSDLTLFEACRTLERLLAGNEAALDHLRTTTAAAIFKQMCRNALDPADATRLLARHPENFAALQREAERCKGFAERLPDSQRDIYVKLRALYAQQSAPEKTQEFSAKT